jgi:hypothetical protein
MNNKMNLKMLWWFINQAFYFYGIHPRHFYRDGWRIKYLGTPKTVLLSKQISISRTQQKLGNGKRIIKDYRTEFKQNKEKYQSFVSKWLRDEEFPLAKQGDADNYMFVMEGYKSNE